MLSRKELANALRILAADATCQAKSGHPGMPLGMADIAEVLWNDFLKHNPQDPHWFNRDRFVVSNGHGSMLLYALLHLTGYELTIEDLKQFRQLHSKTPGHPEYGITPGVETTTGPLGQGLANAVGMAISEKLLANTFNRPHFSIIDHTTYCFVGDGCLMEGISHEACSLAGTLGLGKLIVFWDQNGVSIDGDIKDWYSEDTAKRFEAYGWHVIQIDGHNVTEIKSAIEKGKEKTSQPTLICCKTKIGFGSPWERDAKCHGTPFDKETTKATRQNLQWKHDEPFFIPPEYYQSWDAKEKGKTREQNWLQSLQEYQKQHPELASELLRRLEGRLPENFTSEYQKFLKECQKEQPALATRKASQKVLEYLVPKLPELLGGSADLSESTSVFCKHSKAIIKADFQGNYLHYGVREFAMSAIMNGIALHGGYIPFGSTFLAFLSYCHSAVRMAAIMQKRTIFVYTHDSVALGEDGPTHQPVEQLTLLRMTPHMTVWRPCDLTETAVAWQKALEHTKGPTALILSRQTLSHQTRTEAQLSLIERGGYILWESNGIPEIVLIATGSEVMLAMEATKHFLSQKRSIRVVSMPSVEVFLNQDKTYQEMVLPHNIKRIAIEAGATSFWYRFVGLDGKVIGIDQYGASAPGDKVYDALNMRVERVVHAIEELLEIQGEKQYAN